MLWAVCLIKRKGISLSREARIFERTMLQMLERENGKKSASR
jgi:hypothetical protein